MTARSQLPKAGLRIDQVLQRLRTIRESDVAWRAGLLQGVVYFAGDDVADVAEQAYREYYFENPLMGRIFPSLTMLENDILGITADLLHAPSSAGIVTTGGTESNLLAVWTAVSRARERGMPEPLEIVLPYSAHPALAKAARYFGIREVRVPTGADYAVDIAAVGAAISERTALLVGSAPDYSHGVIDTISELGELATNFDIPLHVDSCLGGFILPFVERLGFAVPLFDFRVPGVTSISADLHKHGYSPKGLSVLLHRDEQSVRQGSISIDNWPYGQYLTNGISGSRSGGVLAAGWAVLQYLGESGFLRITSEIIAITDRFIEGITAIPGLQVIGKPVANKFAFGSHDLDVNAIAEGLEQREWVVDLQLDPPSVNMHTQLLHGPVVERYLADLAVVTAGVRNGTIRATGKKVAYN